MIVIISISYQIVAQQSSPQQARAIQSVLPISSSSTQPGIGVEFNPIGVAVNPKTNMVYVANWEGRQDQYDGDAGYRGTLSVINGNTNTLVDTIRVGHLPIDVAVNPKTNMVYVANYASFDVSVINGSNDTVVKNITLANGITGGGGPTAIAVNPITNKVYVIMPHNNTISIIDGRTNTVLKNALELGKGDIVGNIAVNSASNRIYVAREVFDNSTAAYSRVVYRISIIDGTTDTVVKDLIVKRSDTIVNELQCSCCAPCGRPTAIAVIPITNTVYFVDYQSGTIYVLDGNTSTLLKTIKVSGVQTVDNGTAEFPGQVIDLVANPKTNTLYLTTSHSHSIFVIDAITGTKLKVNTENFEPSLNDTFALAVNPNTNSLYVTNFKSNSVSVLSGNTYNLIIGPTTVSQLAQLGLAQIGIIVGNKPMGIAVNPNTNLLYVTNSHSNTVSVIDGSTDRSVSHQIFFQ
jgi:YVTN family beta-propeller protein